MSKVSVIGAGNVGATCANVLAFREIADEANRRVVNKKPCTVLYERAPVNDYYY